MIRSIVAIDSKRGMADDKGIPWQLPTDQKYFVDQTVSGAILMGYGTYIEFKDTMHGRVNYVATKDHAELKSGFVAVPDVAEFLSSAKEDVWNVGGPGLLTSTLDLVDELYVTQLKQDFHCTKFLPEFEEKFSLTKESETLHENGIDFTFQVWHHN